MEEKVSVIIPIYNSEVYLQGCLDSILNQTHTNLEIIAVNDGSEDGSLRILNNYKTIDSRIKIISHRTNKGLFQARITGVKNATGDFVCFVDADDEISIDWIRLLLKTAIREKSDIVVGNTVNVKEGWKHYYNNAVNFTRFKKPIENKGIIKSFLAQDGSCYHWHTIWNKLYSKGLWQKALPYFEKQIEHLVMTEDILFTFILFYFANKLVFKNIDCYYYFKRADASTARHKSENSLKKILQDVSLVFDFLFAFLDQVDSDEEIVAGLGRLKDKYYRIWCHTIINDYNGKADLLTYIKELFNKEQIVDTYDYDFYFYQTTTEWNSNYENIKAVIASKKTTVISFDIFDTLILRPFWEPSDLFIIMSKSAANLLNINSAGQFINMRKCAENIARGKAFGREDITIDEIYDTFAETYHVDKQTSEKLRDIEIALEKKYCYRRESGIELLEMAKDIGKKVVLTSDMYLSKKTIIEILEGLNIKGYDDIFVSSDEGVLKSTGNLYRCMCRKMKVHPAEVTHVGDNWAIDIIEAQNVGLTTLFFAKTKEIFSNGIANIPVGKCLLPYAKENNTIQRTSVAVKDFAIRSILALVANKFFDKPNYSFQKESDYNGDMYFIGYYCIGFFMLGLSKWLQKEIAKNGHKSIKFLARDGYLPILAFDKLNKIDKRYADIESEYFYASRKALMPYAISNELDFYSIASYINVVAHSGESVLALLQDVLLPLDESKKAEYEKNGIDLTQRFRSYADFAKFINVMINVSYDERKYKEKENVVRDFYKKSFQDCGAIFDIGYSGKLAQIINNLSGKQINTYFVHGAAGANKIAVDNGFEINSYLDFTPAVSGVVMEYFLSSLEGSCVGYNVTDNEVTPVLENLEHVFEQEFAIKTIQQGALDLIDDYVKFFADITEQFVFNNYEIFAPMLNYLCNGKPFDYYFFNYTKLEDELYGRKASIGFLEIYNYYLNASNLTYKSGERTNNIQIRKEYGPNPSWSRLKKAIYYFVFDRKTFYSKVNKKLRKK